MYCVSEMMRDQLTDNYISDNNDLLMNFFTNMRRKLKQFHVYYFLSLSLATSVFRLIGSGISLGSSGFFASTFTWRGASIRKV